MGNGSSHRTLPAAFLQEDKFHFKKNGTPSLPMCSLAQEALGRWSSQLWVTRLLTESAMQSVMECDWPAVLRVMTFLRNDLRKLSNASLCRSPERLGPIHYTVNSKQTQPRVEQSVLEASSDMALIKEEQASNFDSSLQPLTLQCSQPPRLPCLLLSPMEFLTLQRSTSNFAGGDQCHFRWRENSPSKGLH